MERAEGDMVGHQSTVISENPTILFHTQQQVGSNRLKEL